MFSNAKTLTQQVNNVAHVFSRNTVTDRESVFLFLFLTRVNVKDILDENNFLSQPIDSYVKDLGQGRSREIKRIMTKCHI